MIRPVYARARVALSLLLSVGLMATGCGDDSSPSGPGGGGSGPVSARIDGTPWSAPEAAVQAIASAAPGQLGFVGTSLTAPSIGVSLSLGRIPGPGTYPLGVNPLSNAGGMGVVSVNGIGSNTPLSGDAGTVTIATLTSTRVTGTGGWGASANDIGTITVEAVSATRIRGSFEGTLTASVINDTNDPLVITGGNFDVSVET